MDSTKPFPVAAIALLALIIGSPAGAADIEGKLTIDQVTVYSHGAAIVRRGEIAVPAGSNRLIVRGLPDPIDAGSLRVSAGSSAVRLGGVEIEKIVETDLVGETERAQKKKLLALQDQRAALLDDIATAETQLKLIDSLASVPTDRLGKPLVDGGTVPATLSTIATGSAAARAKVRSATAAIRGVDDEIAATKAELDKVKTARKSTSEVRAVLEANATVTVPVSIEYRVADAGWEWLYEARLDTQTKHMTLSRQAAITQGTGEDWRNAEVSVTTAKPRADAGTPRVASLFLRLRDFAPQQDSAAASLEEITVTGSRRGRSFRAPKESEPEDEAPLITTEELATEFVTEYRVPGRVSITANRQMRLYPVSEEEFDAELVARAVLSVEPSARLEATFNYAKDTPNEAGRVQLYRDGAFVGSAALPVLMPGSDVRIPFGVDERIRITVRDEKAESGRRGIVNRQVLSEHRRRYEITSFHGAALPIEIIDRVPVPKDSGIKIEVLQGATAPTVKDLDGKAGVYLWRLAGTPKKTETIRHYYSVRYPGDKQLAGSEQGGD